MFTQPNRGNNLLLFSRSYKCPHFLCFSLKIATNMSPPRVSSSGLARSPVSLLRSPRTLRSCLLIKHTGSRSRAEERWSFLSSSLMSPSDLISSQSLVFFSPLVTRVLRCPGSPTRNPPDSDPTTWEGLF